MVVANIEAGPIKEEKVNAIAEGMRAAVREVLGEDKDLTLVFHDNEKVNVPQQRTGRKTLFLPVLCYPGGIRFPSLGRGKRHGLFADDLCILIHAADEGVVFCLGNEPIGKV